MWFSSDHVVLRSTGLRRPASTAPRWRPYLLPVHQPGRWSVSLLPSSSRTPGLLARRANGARDSIRLCAAMETGTSIPSEQRGPGPVFRSGVCQRVDDVPERGCSHPNKFIQHNDGEPSLLPPMYEIIQPERRPRAPPIPLGWARGPIWGRGAEYRPGLCARRRVPGRSWSGAPNHDQRGRFGPV